MDKILISACLLGRPVRYDGRGKELRHALLARWQAEDRLVPLCPEVAAGLPTPRPPAEIAGGPHLTIQDGAVQGGAVQDGTVKDGAAVLAGRARIVEQTGRDVTDLFRVGAEAALAAATRNGCRFALLTDGSPSCGSQYIYDGSFQGRRVAGVGVVTALLRAHGVEVYAEDRIADLVARLDRRD